MEPMSPFNQMNETMQQLNRFLIDNGLATFIRWWNVMTNPPLCITEEQLGEGLRDHRPGARDRRRRDGGLTRVGERIGFIGLGIMGTPMARNLLAAGFPLTVHSRSAGPVDELVEAGAARAAGPAEVAAASDIVDHDAARHARRRAGPHRRAAACSRAPRRARW